MEILMVRPYQFYFNPQTASNNFFQSNSNIDNANELAIAEFDAMVEKLRAHQIKVKVVQDTQNPSTPDAIFPNNWISTHADGTICLYKIAYGCLSERLDKEAFAFWCDKMQFKPIRFKAVDVKAQPIYHTNVMMCMGAQFVVICLESIPNEQEKQMLLDSFSQTHKQVIEISQDQLNHFAGNMLQVFDVVEKPYLIMSEQAYTSLNAAQLKSLEKYNPIIPIAIPTIESLGGGSTRCMMAEIHLR